MRIQYKNLCLGIFLCLLTNLSYAHVEYQNKVPDNAIKIVALKRAEAPFLITTYGHRMHKTYSLVNRYSYVSVDSSYDKAYPEASAHVYMTRPFIDYRGSRRY